MAQPNLLTEGSQPDPGPRGLTKRSLDWAHAVLVLIVCGGGFLSHWLGNLLAQGVSRKENERFRAEASRWRAVFESELENNIRCLQALRDWVRQEPLTPTGWTHYFHSLNGSVYYPACRAFGYLDHIPSYSDGGVLAGRVETQARERLGMEYQIRATLPGARPGYSWYGMVLNWIHLNLPRETPQPPVRVYGQDFNQVPDLWAAINWSMGEDRPGIAAPILLGDATSLPATVPVFLPVYWKDFDPLHPDRNDPYVWTQARNSEEAEEKFRVKHARRSLRGLVFMLLDVKVLSGQHAREWPAGFGLRISVTDHEGKAHEVFNELGRLVGSAHQNHEVFRGGGRDWIFESAADRSFEMVSSRGAYWSSAGTGWLLTLALAGFVQTQTRARQKQERLATMLEESRQTLLELTEERRRLGRDLHDKTIQSIYSTRLALSLCRERLTSSDSKLKELLSGCELTLEKSIAELRSFIHSRESEPERSLRFTEVLNAMAENMRQFFPGTMHLRAEDLPHDRLSCRQEAELLCIAREALSNSVKHSNARKIEIIFTSERDGARLQIIDDGCGFDPTHVSSGGMGLHNITERAKELGAQLRIDSKCSCGVTLEIHLPLPPPP